MAAVARRLHNPRCKINEHHYVVIRLDDFIFSSSSSSSYFSFFNSSEEKLDQQNIEDGKKIPADVCMRLCVSALVCMYTERVLSCRLVHTGHKITEGLPGLWFSHFEKRTRLTVCAVNR